MVGMLPVLLVFLTVVFALAGAWGTVTDFWLEDRARMTQRLDEEFRKTQRERVKKSSLFKDLGRVARELARPGMAAIPWRDRLGLLLDQAGLDWTLSQVGLCMAGIGGVSGLAAGFFRQSLLIGLGVGLLGATVPCGYIHHRRKARRDRMLAQLPDAFETMARSLRAGQSLSQALQSVALEGGAPLAIEFSYCYEQQNLGLALETAFQDLARRCDLLEVKIFVLATLVQQQTGGNLADLLDKLAEVVRERFRACQKIRTLTAESRLQANILLGLPPLVFVILMVAKPDYAGILLTCPRLLLGIFLSQLLGAWWIRRIVSLRA